MLVLKLMVLFAVAYAHKAAMIANPRETSLKEKLFFGLSLNMLKASSSGRHGEIPNEVSNSRSHEGKPDLQTSTKVESKKSENKKPTNQEAATDSSPTTTEASPTTTEASPTTTEASLTTTEESPTTTDSGTGPLYEVCPSRFEAVWVSDYSEAEKHFMARFTDVNVEECCQIIDTDGGNPTYEFSLSMEDGVCTIYNYAPYNKSTIRPPPKKDGNDKILNLFQPPIRLCSFQYKGEDIYISRVSARLIPEPQKPFCDIYDCENGKIDFFDKYPNFGDERCLGVMSKHDASTTEGINPWGYGLFNIVSDSDEQHFVSQNWTIVLENANYDHLHVDVDYNSDEGEYRWSQSYRPIANDSPLWAQGYPSASRLPCVSVYADGLHDVACGSSLYLAVVRDIWPF